MTQKTFTFLEQCTWFQNFVEGYAFGANRELMSLVGGDLSVYDMTNGTVSPRLLRESLLDCVKCTMAVRGMLQSIDSWQRSPAPRPLGEGAPLFAEPMRRSQ